jgi:hypothetical protein
VIASFLSRGILVLITDSGRSLPLGYYFFLDKKVAKNQDGKNLLPARPAPGPVFRRAFTRFFWVAILITCHSERAKNLLKAQFDLCKAKKILRSLRLTNAF